jgi:hypothetical protein
VIWLTYFILKQGDIFMQRFKSIILKMQGKNKSSLHCLNNDVYNPNNAEKEKTFHIVPCVSGSAQQVFVIRRSCSFLSKYRAYFWIAQAK